MDSIKLYDILYALAAIDGREKALFGECRAASREAFSRSLAGDAFPELWFEIPLAGNPWLDFHVLTSFQSVAGTQAAFSGQDGIYADALLWFASQEPGKVRQLALSYDTSSGNVDRPAVQLLVNSRDPSVAPEFLKAVGRTDLCGPYASFVDSMPSAWYACYTGVFPGRDAASTDPWVRVECIMNSCQQAYAESSDALRQHVARIGLEEFDDNLVAGVQMLARSPFPLELQFNVGPDGKALPVLSASIRFQPNDWVDSTGLRTIGRLATWLQAQDLADERCDLLSQTVFAKRVEHHDFAAKISCFPAFVKLRWQAGGSPVAKVYFKAQMQQVHLSSPESALASILSL